MGTIDISSDLAPLVAEIKALETKLDALEGQPVPPAPPVNTPPVPPAAGSSQVFNGGKFLLNAGQSLNVGKAVFAMQADGNFVVTDASSAVVFETGTQAASAHIVFQEDGNLVVYAPGALWASGSSGGGSTLVLSDSAPFMTVMSVAGKQLWTSGAALSTPPVVTPPVNTPPVTTPPVVGTGFCMIGSVQYPTFAAAAAAVQAGQTIEVHGVLVNDSAAIQADNVSVVGKTPDAAFTWPAGNAQRMAWGKAFIVAENPGLTVKSLDFSGMTIPDSDGGNACAIRVDPGCTSILVDSCHFHDGEEGMLTGSSSGTITVTNCIFERLGSGSGFTHGIYVNAACDVFTISDCTFLSQHTGHHIKSRAQKTVVTRCVLADLDGDTSYAVDAPQGGDVEISHCVIEQGPNPGNKILLTFCAENANNKVFSYKLHNNVIINDFNDGYGVLTGSNVTQAMLDIHDNTWVGPLEWIVNPPLTAGANNTMVKDRATAGIAAYPALPALP